MLENLKKVSAIILAFWMLIATGGYSVYSHNCSCCNKHEVSMVQTVACCPGNKNSEKECSIEGRQGKSCCHAGENVVIVTAPVCSKSSCCEVSMRFFKLSNSFDKSPSLDFKPLQLLKSIVVKVDSEPLVSVFVKKIIVISKNAPPGQMVRDFILYCHSLKIPFSASI